jgi:ubiquinone/menaquinone biosynthesis C-methylase UbiE
MTPKRDYFNGLAELWDGFQSPPDTATKLSRFVSLAVPPTARRILDVGCGTGILLEPLRSSGVQPSLIVELDSAQRMLVRNRQKLTGEQPVSHICGDAGRLPFPDGCFDAILCFNALPHLEPIADVLERMVDCLLPSGVLSVGHLANSENLNAFHASLDGPVSHDRLPKAAELAGLIRGMNAEVVREEEAADWYLVQARKRG